MKNIVWGAGGNAEKVINLYTKLQIPIHYIVDKDSQKWGMMMNGIEVKNPDHVFHETEEVTVIISSLLYEESIYDSLKERHRDNIQIIKYSDIFGRESHAEYGEDIIVYRILRKCNITNPQYIEIGIPASLDGSNTRYFYDGHCKGVCIEANPQAYQTLKETRKRDVVMNMGVSGKNNSGKILPFYCIKGSDALNTFSKRVLDVRLEQGFEVEKILEVECKSLDEIFTDLKISSPDFVSIDVEGMELEVLKDFDFNKYQVKVWSIEKGEGIKELMLENHYELAAETPANYIFCFDALVNQYVHFRKSDLESEHFEE